MRCSIIHAVRVGDKVTQLRNNYDKGTAGIFNGTVGTVTGISLADLRVLSLAEDRGFFNFTDHLEKSADFDDHLIIDIDPTATPPAGWARWASEIPTTLRDYQPQGPALDDTNQAPGVWEHTVPLPEAARFLGSQVGIQLTARARPPLTATAQPTT